MTSKIKLIIAFVIITLLSACSKVEPENYSFYIFLDNTEYLSIEESLKMRKGIIQDLSKIYNEAGLNSMDKIFNGVELNFYLLGALSSSAHDYSSLEKGSTKIIDADANPYIRKTDVNKFIDSTNIIAENFLRINFGEDASKIFMGICKVANKVISNKKDNDNIYMIIYSDMLEFIPEKFTFFYNPSIDFDNINPSLNDKLHEDFRSLTSTCSMPDLSGVKIHIVSKRDEETDAKINYAEKLWGDFFRSKNAKVVFDSQLRFNY